MRSSRAIRAADPRSCSRLNAGCRVASRPCLPCRGDADTKRGSGMLRQGWHEHATHVSGSARLHTRIVFADSPSRTSSPRQRASVLLQQTTVFSPLLPTCLRRLPFLPSSSSPYSRLRLRLHPPTPHYTHFTLRLTLRFAYPPPLFVHGSAVCGVAAAGT
ncbi:hypothetical protein C8J57DRAFT_665737 [Mycena rebaudengoi]|nr:hypothetical protein C8J57DRAFT_665737 [Mycena rebaudengoi]